VVDFSTYQPPGVYVDEGVPNLVSVGTVAPTVVAIVGPSVGYRVATETVTLSGVGPVVLSKTGIDLVNGFTVTGANNVVYLASDFTLAASAGADGNILTTADNTTSIMRTVASTILTGQSVYVSYRYTDSSYFLALRATDLDDVQAAFGPALDLDTGAILSPLSFAAKFAFDNGAATVVLAATSGTATLTTVAQLNAAYSALDSITDANIIVPLPVGIVGTDALPGEVAAIGTGLNSYITAQALQDVLRIGIVGVSKSVTIDPATLTAGYSSKRMMQAHPNRLLYFNGSANASIEISGYYLAAAYAGRLAGQVVQMPLTKKQIRGFAGVPVSMLSAMTTSKKNAWSNAGVAVAEVTRQGVLVVRHGTSTDRTSVNTREVSLVRARDSLVALIETTLDSSGLIGSFLQADSLTQITGVITGILETATTLGFIVAYSDTKVRQRVGQPSVIEVKFRYKPAYPLNYIVVSFSVNLDTGSTADLTV